MEEIINVLKECFIEISNKIKTTSPFDLSNTNNCINSSGDITKYLDQYSNDLIKNNLLKSKYVKAIVSEEESNLVYTSFNDAKYLVSYDPLDGSSNIDVNISIGTIFAIYEFINNEVQSGRNIVGAGYCLYGASTQLIIATNAVDMFMLIDNNFIEVKKNLSIKNKGNIYSINESYKYIWNNQKINNLIDQLIKQNYSARWVGSLVADAHRTLIKGGIFLYPSNNKDKNGKIRVLYEAYPFAYIFEKANGKAFDGNINVLDIPFPKNIHIQTPIILSGPYEFDILYN